MEEKPFENEIHISHVAQCEQLNTAGGWESAGGKNTHLHCFPLFSRCLLLATVRDGFLSQLSPGLIQYARSYDSLKTDALQMHTL